MKATISHMFGIPITSVVRESKLPRGYFMAKAGTYLKIAGRKTFVGGYSFQKSEEHARTIAKYEVLERLLALPGVAEQIGNTGRDFPSCGLFQQSPSIPVQADEVLIGVQGVKRPLDASGLAVHTDYKLAIQNAALEVMERHILAEIWYNRSFSLHQITQPIGEIGDYTVMNFTVNNQMIKEIQIPFVLTIIEDLKGEFLLAGSALALTLEDALEKANREGFMLLDSFVHNDNGFTNGITNDTELRRASLKGPLAAIRRDHLLSLTKTPVSVQECKPLTLHEIWLTVFGNDEHAYVCNIFSKENFHLVRVTASCANRLRDFRSVRLEKNVVDDPFC